MMLMFSTTYSRMLVMLFIEIMKDVVIVLADRGKIFGFFEML